MRLLIPFFLTVFLVLVACGSKEKPMPDPSAQQPMNMPGVQPDVAEAADVSKLDTLPGFSKLPAVERDIFSRTIQLQVKHYANLERWADEANTVKTGRDASTSLRLYIAYLEEFEQRMKALDKEFVGKISPDYSESKQFNAVVEAYMSDPELQRRTEYIMNSLLSLMQHYKEDPACKDVFADLEKFFRQAQPR